MSKKKILCIVCIVLIILVYCYYKIILIHRNNNLFAKNSIKYAEENENPIFKLEKILVYSDANIEDLSSNSDLSNINISQFTDFAIYIDNKSKYNNLTAENTINNVYIDNISLTPTSIGEQKVYFKNIKNFCKYEKIVDGVNKIEYKTIHKNNEKTDENVFFTDASEPLILSYVNENIIKDIDVSTSNEKLTLDGSMLKYLNVNLNDLKYKISFKINIENNLGEKFACDCSLNINLESSEGGIYTGYIMQIYDMKNLNYIFRKIG